MLNAIICLIETHCNKIYTAILRRAEVGDNTRGSIGSRLRTDSKAVAGPRYSNREVTITVNHDRARIGYAGPREPTPGVLRAIVAGHTAAIPFENLDVLAKRPIR